MRNRVDELLVGAIDMHAHVWPDFSVDKHTRYTDE